MSNSRCNKNLLLCSTAAAMIFLSAGPVDSDFPGARSEGIELQQTGEFDFSEIDRLLQNSLSEIEGGCSLVLIKDGSVIYRKAFGSLTPDSAVPIGTASQWLSAGVVMALADEGTLGLDDKVSDYLPQFSGASGAVTIRQLLSHTGGFPHRLWHYRNHDRKMEDTVSIIAETPLEAEPGTEFIQSDSGLQVADWMAEVATGEYWMDLFAEKLAGPLEMRLTSDIGSGETGNPVVPGRVIISADDYARFLWMLVNNGRFNETRILSVASVREMLRNQTGMLPIDRRLGEINGGPDSVAQMGYGIGCRLEGWDRRSGNAFEASSEGAFGCSVWIDLKRKIAGVFLAYKRELQINEKGEPFNEALALFAKVKRIIDRIIPVARPVSAVQPQAEEREVERPVPPPGGRKDETPFQLAVQMLKRNDKNGDKMLSRNETPQRLAPAFNRIDRNRDGKLNIRELVQALRVIAKLRPNERK